MSQLNVGLLTSQHLGWACAEIVKDTPGVRVVEHDHVANYWNGPAGVDLSYSTREEPDFFVSVLWPRRVTADALARHRYVNLHPAPLPAYRGRNAPVHAIINGETRFGATLHYMDEGFDTGPIIATRGFTIPPNATGRSLYDLAQLEALDLFEAVWPMLVEARGVMRCFPQDPAEGAYYAADSLEPYRDSTDPTVVRAMTFPGR